MLNKIKTAALAANLLLIENGSAAPAYVDYTQNGANWPNSKGECDGPNQSPIDLFNSASVIDATYDNFTKHYENIVPDARAGQTKERSKV